MRNKKLSDTAQTNSDTLVSFLQDRLRSSGKTKSSDTEGNTIYVDCDIYTKEVLESFIDLSISEFNQIPTFTYYSLEDSLFVETFTEVLVEGATLYALASQALIERGREFQILDNGISFDPPVVSELLNTQYSTLLSHHWKKLNVIKLSNDVINFYKR
jgi:hypothetical protein